MSAEFDLLLEAHLKEGASESSGQFTIDKAAALSKIAQNRFPYEDAWVLKLAQAAVLSGSDRLDIRQTNSATEFRFSPRENWSALEFQQNFTNPAVTLPPAQEALRAGLWSIGAGKHRPFKIRFPGQSCGCLWLGDELVSIQEAGDQQIEITVSHRVRQAGKDLPLVGQLKTIQLNREILSTIHTGLYTAPLKLTVNGKRLDGFQFSPERGFTKYTFVLRALPIRLPETTPLGIPPGFREKLLPEISSKDRALWEFFDPTSACQEPAPTAIALLSATTLALVESCVYWVKAGVVIQKEIFSQIGHGRTALSLFINADDLPTDLSGFGLQETASTQLRERVCRALTNQLQLDQLDARLQDRNRYRQLTIACGAIGAGGAALAATVAPLAFALVPLSIVARILLGRRGDQDYRIWTDLHRLIEDWAKAFPDPAGYDPRAELKKANYFRPPT